MIPGLNQICNLYNTSYTKEGSKVVDILATGVNCRIFVSTGEFKDRQGNLIEYNASVHLPPQPLVYLGDVVEYLDGANVKKFEILYCGQTPNISGIIIKQFARLKQIYAN